MTGRGPAEHGLYGEWAWRPDAMSLGPLSWNHLDPFWRADAGRGRHVTVLDVPFASVLDVAGCVEVPDWGAHDLLGDRLQVAPRRLEPLVVEAGGVHPFAAESVSTSGPTDRAGLERVVVRCLDGVAQRGSLARRLLTETAPDLLLVVFTELHRAGHLLWHTVDPAHPGHAAEPAGDHVRRPGAPGPWPTWTCSASTSTPSPCGPERREGVPVKKSIHLSRLNFPHHLHH